MRAARLPSTSPKTAQVFLLAAVFALLCLLFYGTVFCTHRPMSLFSHGPEPGWQEVVCKRAGHWDEESGIPLKQLFSNVTPEENNNVFLMDTACNPRPKHRVWCSVESWARQNPNLQVWFLFISGGLAEAELPHVLLQQYTNLHVVGADLDDLFRDTPLLPLFTSRRWTWEDTWPVELLSDMLRVLVLWWWGGVYSDTDVLSIQPLTLPLNSLGFQSPDLLGSAFISFRARHPILLELMRDMQQNFKISHEASQEQPSETKSRSDVKTPMQVIQTQQQPKQWGSIGPQAMSRVMPKACLNGLDKLAENAPAHCPGNFTLYPTRTFYPIPYQAYKRLFRPGRGKDFDKIFNETFAIHFWNKMSKATEVKVNSSSIYEVAAKNFCPLTYQIAVAESDAF